MAKVIIVADNDYLGILETYHRPRLKSLKVRLLQKGRKGKRRKKRRR